MAHFALINEENIVESVIVVNNSVLIDSDTELESENIGIEFCKSLYGENTQWVQTSYNNNFRGNFANIGYTYNSDLDVFLPPTPYPSWVVDTETCQWKAPIPAPDDGKFYVWNEEHKNWVLPGSVYNSEFGVFLYPQPYPSWTLDMETYEWTPPVPYPDLDDGNVYAWDEDNLSWIFIPMPME
jgi:hypothetical protein